MKIFVIISNILIILLLKISTAFAETHLQIGCKIYSLDKKLIRQHPGQFCLFFADGRFVSTSDDFVKMYDSNLNILWQKKIASHHQINLSEDQNEILIIASENIHIKNKNKFDKARSDVLYVLSLNGGLLKKFSLYKNNSQIQKKSWKAAVERKFKIQLPKDRNRFRKTEWEITHTNSFYEVSPEFLKKNPQIENAKYIVNDISLMLVFFLDKNLKKIVWQGSITDESWTMFHDVQTLDNGNLLIYDNGTKLRPYTQLLEFNLQSNKVVWKYNGLFDTPFFSPHWGGLQKLKSGNYFYTDITNKFTINEISSTGKLIWQMEASPNTYLQQAKKIDLTSFLKFNNGL